jgi:hypothetical protein
MIEGVREYEIVRACLIIARIEVLRVLKTGMEVESVGFCARSRYLEAS